MNDPQPDQDASLARAVDLLKSGGLVAFPTETVYGLGADATNANAVRQIFAAKGRPATNPLIVHVSDANVARRYVRDWPAAAQTLARLFWPGPLTLVLSKADVIVTEVTAGLPCVGVRVPDHPLALKLLRRFDGPIAAPSANRANRISPTAADHVRRELGDAVKLVLDGGPCQVGIESTVLDLVGNVPTILRPGAVTLEQLERAIGSVHVLGGSVPRSAPAPSPGRQQTHYSPTAPAWQFGVNQAAQVAAWLESRAGQAASLMVIAQSPSHLRLGAALGARHRIICMPDNAPDYARCIYAALREADGPGCAGILVEMPPQGASWAAIHDRLRRATRPL